MSVIILKELPSISWQVDEPTYRKDPALSQSTLSTYERAGFDGLDHLFDHKETPSLTFGSAVDAILTGGSEEFNSRFLVLNINITDSGKDVINKLISMNLPYDSFDEIPQDIVSSAAKEVGFWKADKWDKRRYTEVLNTGDVVPYYQSLKNSDKTILDTTTYTDVCNCVRAIHESPATSPLFADNDELSPIRRYYQLKFRAKHNGVSYRGMMDLIIVDYENKIIYPYDLKTSSGYEWNFPEHFLQWGYFNQARLYWRLIKANISHDPYFKDFELKDFKFVVVNRKTLTPLVWEFPLTQSLGTLIDEKGNEYRDPFTIGEELQGYLNLRPQVPNGISIDSPNTIFCLKIK